MFQYRQVLVRLRAGDSVREIARSGLMGRDKLGELRAGIERFPRQAALKLVVGRRGVPIREDVRAPLRRLTDTERDELSAWLA